MGSSEEGEDDSGKKKHAGTSQKAQKGPDFSKLLVPYRLTTLHSDVYYSACMYTCGDSVFLGRMGSSLCCQGL